MTFSDIMFYVFYGMLYLFVADIYVRVRWPRWYYGKRSKKKRQHRVKTF
jgi:hypothetical protein